jgi:tetratricopeptide (TPR) repeat protein
VRFDIPGQASAARASSPAAEPSARERDATHEVSLADMSLASFSANLEAQVSNDATQDVSLHELSLASRQAESAASPRSPEETNGFASTLPPAPLVKAAGSPGWLWALGLPLLLGVGWFVLSGRSPSKEPVSAPPPAGISAAAVPAAAPEPTAARPQVDDTEQEPAARPGNTQDAPAGEPDAPQLASHKRADTLVAQANQLRRRRKLAQARAKYQAALVLSPDHVGALHGLVQIAIQQRDGKQVLEPAQKLAELRPDELSYQVLLGDAYKLAGKPRDAREVWQAAARKGSSAARKRLK